MTRYTKAERRDALRLLGQVREYYAGAVTPAEAEEIAWACGVELAFLTKSPYVPTAKVALEVARKWHATRRHAPGRRAPLCPPGGLCFTVPRGAETTAPSKTA